MIESKTTLHEDILWAFKWAILLFPIAMMISFSIMWWLT